MKEGRTHLAHKAEHAVDLETGAMVAVTLQGADAGDTTTIIETAIAAAEQIEDAQAGVTEPQTLDEIIGDQGYHSNQTMLTPTPSASARPLQSQTGVDATGHRCPRLRRRCMGIVAGFVDHAAAV
jgi:hypothetical protein